MTKWHPLQPSPLELTSLAMRAIRDARGVVMRDRLIAAAREAAERGLLQRREVDEVLAEIGPGATGAA